MAKYEPALRLTVFVLVLFVMALWEVVAPRRVLSANKAVRWFSNLTLAAINSVVVRLAFALGATGVAWEAQSRQWGILNNADLPHWLEFLLALLCLDLAIYLQHVLFHAIPLLWRLHQVHHADPDFDVSTGLRFHTLEIALSMGIKVAAIALLGPPPLAVLTFELLLNANSLFNHSNVRMPAQIDGLLRLLVVTPDMHRVHHSPIPTETNSNFGFNFPWWDRLFGTYRSQPSGGHDSMQIGLSHIPARQAIGLYWLFALPFVAKSGDYPLSQSPETKTPTEF